MIKTIVYAALMLAGLTLQAETTAPQEHFDIRIPVVDMEDFFELLAPKGARFLLPSSL